MAMLIVFFLIFQICAFHQGVSFSLRLLPPGSPGRGMSPWVALPIKGERSGLTRLSFPAPRLSFSLYSIGEPGNSDFDFSCEIGVASLLETVAWEAGPLCATWFVPNGGGLCAPPLGPGLCCRVSA